MSSKEKLDRIAKLLKTEYTEMKAALEQDGEYNSLDGNGTNSSEAVSAFEPIYTRIMKIIGHD